MSSHATSGSRPLRVRAVPIELCQLLKFGGLAETGGAAKHAIQDGRVSVNGQVERQKGRKLQVGDQVTFQGETLVVALE